MQPTKSKITGERKAARVCGECGVNGHTTRHHDAAVEAAANRAERTAEMSRPGSRKIAVVPMPMWDAQAKLISHEPSANLAEVVWSALLDGSNWGSTNPDCQRTVAIYRQSDAPKYGHREEQCQGIYTVHYKVTQTAYPRIVIVAGVSYRAAGMGKTEQKWATQYYPMQELAKQIAADFLTRDESRVEGK